MQMSRPVVRRLAISSEWPARPSVPGDVQVVQALEEQVLLVGVLGQQIVVVVLAELQAGDHRLLQRCGAAQVSSSQISAKVFMPTMVAVFFSPAYLRSVAGISTRPWASGSQATALA